MEEKPRAEARRTFWKFEWDLKCLKRKNVVSLEQREKAVKVSAPWLIVSGIKVSSSLLARALWGRGSVSSRQEGRAEGGNHS